MLRTASPLDPHARALPLVGLGLLLLAPTSSATPSRLEAEAKALAALGTGLSTIEARMEAAYGYAGAKQTVGRIFERAGLDAKERVRGAAWGGKLYVIWTELQPFFSAQRAAVGRTAKALEAAGHLGAEDAAWLAWQRSRLDRVAEGLDSGLEALVAQRVEMTRTIARFRAAKAQLLQTKEVLARLGGAEAAIEAQRQELEIIAAELTALQASEQWLIDALREDAGATWLRPLVPVAERPSRFVGSLALEGTPVEPPWQTARGTAERVPPPHGAVVGGLVAAAEAAGAMARIEARALGQHARWEEEIGHVRALEGRLTEVTRAGDLEDARRVMSRVQSIQGEIATTRAAIASTSLDTPKGRKRAERLARKVLELRGKLPGLKAVQAELLKADHLEAWRRNTASERSARLSAAAAARREEAAAVGDLIVAAGTLWQSEARRSLHAAATLLDEIAIARAAVRATAGPQLIEVRAGEDQVLFVARRPTDSALEAGEAAIREAVARVRTLGDLRMAVDLGLVGSALYAEAGRVEEGPSAPPPVDPTRLERALAQLAGKWLLRRPLDKGTAETLRWRYRVVGATTEDALASMRLRADRTLGSARDAFAGRALKAPAKPEAVDPAALGRVMARLDRLLGAAPKALDEAVDRLVPRATEGAGAPGSVRRGARARYARALLATLLHVPVSEVADAALVDAVRELRRVLVLHGAPLDGLDERDGYQRRARSSFLEGRPLTIRVSAVPERPAPTVLLAGQPVEPAGRDAGYWLYRVRRAEGLAAGPRGAVELVVRP